MISIKGILQAPKEQIEFLNDYISMIENFNFSIENYQDNEDEKISIKNTDLWIESYIDKVPALCEFRDFVRDEMKKLNIEPYSEFIYKEDNHYIYGNKNHLNKFKSTL